MNIKVRILLLGLLSLTYVSLTMGPSEAFAATCGKAETTIIKCDAKGGFGAIGSLLVIVINFLAAGVALAVLAGIIYGAVLYASAGDSSEQAKKGIKYVTNAVLAIILFVFMYAFLNFLIPGGLF